MTQQIIDVGANANDGTGEPLRQAFTAVNDNFTQIWTAGPVGSQVQISGNIVTTTVTNLGLTLAGNGIGNIQANSTVVPGTSGVYDLGAPDRTFQYIYGDYLVGNGALITGIVANTTYNDSNVAAFLPTYTGNLVSLTGPVVTTANVVAGNIITTGFLGVTGNILGGNITGNNLISSGIVSAAGNITTTANISGQYILGNGALLTGITATNISAAALTGTTLSSNVLYSSLKVVDDLLYLDVVGNITTSGRFIGSGAGLTNIPGANVSGQVANALVSGTVYTNAQPNITSVGTLTSLTATGNITGNYFIGNGSLLTGIAATNVNANALVGTTLSSNVLYSSLQVVDDLLYLDVVGNVTTQGQFIGSGAGLSNIPAANITGQVSNALTAGTVTTNAQPNITSVGTLTSLTATGNIAGNYFIGNGALLTGISTSGVNANALVGTTLSSNVLYSSLKVVDDLLYLSVVGNVTIDGRYIGSGAGLTNLPGANVSGTVANATYAVTAGTAYSVAGANVTGTVANATYAVTAGTATTANTATIATYANTANAVAGANVSGTVANATYAVTAGTATTANTATTAGTVTTAAQPNITSVGTLTQVSISGNATAGNISTSGKISAVGNITGNYFIGNGALLTGVSATNVNANALVGDVLSSNVLYSSLKVVDDLLYLSVVGNVTANGQFSGSGAGLTNIPGANITGTVANATYANAAGTATTATYANIANTVAGANVTGTVANATYAVTAGSATTASTVTSGAQPNITSVGTLSSVSVTGNVAGGNILTTGSLSATGNVTGNYFIGNGRQLTGIVSTEVGVLANLSVTGNTVTGNLLTGGSISAVGNIKTVGNVTGNYFIGNGSQLTGITVAAGTAIVNGNSNVNVGANGNVAVSVAGVSNVAVFDPAGVTVTGLISATGNVAGNYLLGNGALITGLPAGYSNADVANYLPTYSGNLVSLAGPVVTTANVTGGNVLTGGLVSATGNVTGNYILGNGALLTGVITSVANINNGTSNVTVVSSGGNITVGVNGTSNVAVFADTGEYITGVVSASGNIVGNNLITGGVVSATGNITGNYFIGNGSQLTGVAASSVNAAALVGNTLSSNVLYSSLTQVGELANLSVVGNTIGGNIATGGIISAAGAITSSANITGANVLTSGIVSATGDATAGNIYTAGQVSATANVTGGNILTAGLISSSGTITSAANVTGANLITSGLVTATGNVTGGNVSTSGQVSATGNIIGGNVQTSGNISGGNVISATTVSATADVIGGNLATVGAITATGNATAGNILTAGVVSATSNITGGNVLTSGLVSATGTITSAANITGANLITSGLVTVTGNVAGGNLLTSGLISASGNVVSNNVLASGLVSAVGNVIGGNVNTSNIQPLSGSLTISTASGNLNLQPAGNIVLANTYINGVAYPQQDQDAASKIYVDNLATTAITYHQPVYAATTTDLATTTGGTITYTQPNGASNGIGAYLSTTGSFDLVDTANIQTVGTRVLVKNEANAVLNGVYTWSNATVIVRSADADQYGAASTEEISINDYFFVSSGNVNAGSAYVVSAPAGTITFGTSNITFSQFSSSQTYTANTSAGISLSGTVINAKVDQNTTAFDGGGNIIVKAGANLTTPNIGAATGTSLSVTGNVTGGNVLTGGLISATSTITSAANITGGNVLTGGLISATSTITSAANITGGNLLTGGLISSTGAITSAANVNANNVIATTIVNAPSLTGTTVSVTANVTGGNVLTGGLISATSTITSAANITGGNVLTGGLVSATGTVTGSTLIGSVVTASGNVTGGNILTGGLISATSTITSAANVTGGNLLTAGLVSATGSITSAANVNANNVIATTIVNAPSLTGTTVSVTANVTGGNLLTGGLISATSTITSAANITGGNVLTGGLISATSTITSAANITGGNLLTGGVISSTGNITSAASITGGNLATGGTLSATGNVIGGNVVTVGVVSATGNVYGNAILSDNYLYANGVPIPTGIVYTASTTPPAGPDVGDQWYDTTNDVLYEYINDGTTSYWVDTTSPAFAGGVVANVAISGTLVPIANVTYDIGTSTTYFHNTYTQNLYTNNRLPAYNMPLGAVVQTVMSSSLGGSITNSTSYADITYANVTITPSSTTSKVLIIATGTTGFTALSGQDVSADTQLVRSPSTSLQIQTVGTSVSGGGVGATGAVAYSYMDNPGTTSAVTYKLQQKVSNASSTLTSTNIWLIAMEIAAS